MKENAPYTPNHIPLGQRWGYGILSVAAIAYGSYGLWIDDIFLPGKRGRGIHFQGFDAWLIFAAILCFAANGVSVIVDHFDTRNNETNYRRFAKAMFYAGMALFAMASLIRIMLKAQGL